MHYSLQAQGICQGKLGLNGDFILVVDMGVKCTVLLAESDTKKRRRGMDVMREVIEQGMERRERAASERHKEKVELMREFIDVMKDLSKK